MERQRKRRPVPQEKKPGSAPEVNYTPPVPLSGMKLFLQLLTVAAVVVAIFLGLSLFFRVGKINVSGNQKYDAWTVREASGIRDGEGLLSFGKAKAAGKITQALPYVKQVRIGITLPDTVNIYIEELEVVYAAKDTADQWWLMTADGRIVEPVSSEEAAKHTEIKGIVLQAPKVGSSAVAKEKDPGDGEVITTTNAMRLNAAIEILTQLERNGILGDVVSVDVENLGAIELWYGTRFQIKLGTDQLLAQKVAATKQAISQMSKYESGILDVTFEEGPNKVGYNPF